MPNNGIHAEPKSLAAFGPGDVRRSAGKKGTVLFSGNLILNQFRGYPGCVHLRAGTVDRRMVYELPELREEKIAIVEGIAGQGGEVKKKENEHDPIANVKLDEIGVWSEIKIAILREYASVFTRILKAQKWCKGCCYVDAFAGAGVHISKETREMVPGSPMNALLVEPQFDRIVLIDLDADKVEYLKALCGDDKRVEIELGDCNEILPKKIIPKLTYDSFWRGLCVLDPYGIHGKVLRWQTIKQLADLRTIDIFINFPLMDINRNTLRKGLANADDTDVAAFSEFCGTEDWKDLMYQPDLFGELGKIGNNQTLAKWFRKRIEKDAGFKFVPEPILMQNSKGGPLYFLYFASHQAVAQDVVLDIFNKYRKVM